MILNKKQIDLLKVLEGRLHYTYKAIKEFNKDIRCGNGQRYPVPVTWYSNSTKPLRLAKTKRKYLRKKKEDGLEKQLEFSFTNGHLEEGDNDIQWQKDNKSK